MPRKAWHTLPAWPRASQKLSKGRATRMSSRRSRRGAERASSGRSALCKASGALGRCAALRIEGVCLSRVSANPGRVFEPCGGVPVVCDVRLEDEDEGEAGAHHGEVEGGDVVDAAIGCDTAQHSGGGGAGW